MNLITAGDQPRECHERDFSDFSFKFPSSFRAKINRIMTSCYS